MSISFLCLRDHYFRISTSYNSNSTTTWCYNLKITSWGLPLAEYKSGKSSSPCPPAIEELWLYFWTTCSFSQIQLLMYNSNVGHCIQEGVPSVANVSIPLWGHLQVQISYQDAAAVISFTPNIDGKSDHSSSQGSVPDWTTPWRGRGVLRLDS